MTRFSNAAAWILSGMLFLVAVVSSNLSGIGIGAVQLTFDDVALPRLAVALVGVAAVWLLLAVMAARGNVVLWDWTWVALGALSLWAIISGALADSSVVWLGQSERLEGVVTIVLYALLFGAGLQMGRSTRFIRRAASAFALAAVPLCLYGLLQVAKLDPTNYKVSGYSFYLGSAFANLGNPNFLAGLLVLALSITVGLALTATSTIERACWWVSALLVLGTIYATYSQGAWLAVVIQGAIAIGFWVLNRRAPRSAEQRETRSGAWRAALIAGLIVVVGVAAIVGATAIANKRGLRLWGSSLSETGSGRILLAQTAFNAVRAKPVFGYGPDNFLTAFRQDRPERYVQVFGAASTNSNAHSWPLQFASTLGVLGGLLLAAALVIGLVRSRPQLGIHMEDRSLVLSAGIWIGLTGYAITMMLNVAMLASTVPFWVLLGMISSPLATRVELPKVAARSLLGVCGVLVVVAVGLAGTLVAADAAFMASRRAYNHDAPGDPVAISQRAAKLNPTSVKYARGLAQSKAALVFSALERAGEPTETIRTLYADAVAAYKRPLRLSPEDYSSYSWLAGLQAATGARLKDAQILADAKATAQHAATLDRAHWTVNKILEGDTSNTSIQWALSANGLP